MCDEFTVRAGVCVSEIPILAVMVCNCLPTHLPLLGANCEGMKPGSELPRADSLPWDTHISQKDANSCLFIVFFSHGLCVT